MRCQSLIWPLKLSKVTTVLAVLRASIERGVIGMYDISYTQSGRHRRRRASVYHPVRREAGMTTLGLIILVVFVGMFAFAGIRLTPVYLNYFKVVGVVNGVYEEFDGQNPSRSVIRTSIARRFSVESVSVITARDVSVTAVDAGFEVAAKYDHTTPFISNISFTAHFDKTVVVRR